MNCRTSLGSKYPFPSLSQHAKMLWRWFMPFRFPMTFFSQSRMQYWIYSDAVSYNIMSKSVRSHASSSAQQQEALMVKEKIREVLLAIKEERQHIENRLFQNQVGISRLRKEYELLRYEHDFEHLNEEEAVVVQQLKAGLRENKIDPQCIMGGKADKEQECRQLSRQEVIAVQEVMMGQLRQLLEQ